VAAETGVSGRAELAPWSRTRDRRGQQSLGQNRVEDIRALPHWVARLVDVLRRIAVHVHHVARYLVLTEPWNKKTGRPKSCGLYLAVELACMYIRQNATQEFLGDLRDTSQFTVSRIVTTLVPMVKGAWRSSCRPRMRRSSWSTVGCAWWTARSPRAGPMAITTSCGAVNTARPD